MSEKCILCVCCGRRGLFRQIIEFGGDRLCHACSEEYTTLCDRCGERVYRRDARQVNNRTVCLQGCGQIRKATLRAVVTPDRGNNCFRGYPDRGYRVYDACRGSSVSWDCGLSVFCRWLPVIQPMPL